MAIRRANLYIDLVGQGPPLIFLHGGPGLDHTYLRPYFRDLETAHQLIYYDQRCSGQSEGHPDQNEVTVHRFLADLEAIRKGLELPQIRLVGHSWGALLALKYALAFPTHVRALVLISPFPPTNDALQSALQRILAARTNEERETLAQLAASEGVLRGNVDAVNSYLNQLFRPYFSSATARPVFQFSALTAKNSLLVANLMRNDLGNYNLLSEVGKLACPTLTLIGKEDPISFPSAELWHQQLPNDQRLLLDKAGHFPFVEAPEACTRAIQAFCTAN